MRLDPRHLGLLAHRWSPYEGRQAVAILSGAASLLFTGLSVRGGGRKDPRLLETPESGTLNTLAFPKNTNDLRKA